MQMLITRTSPMGIAAMVRAKLPDLEKAAAARRSRKSHPGLYDKLETEEQEILKKLDEGRIALQEGARKRQEYDEFRNGNNL